MSIEHQPPHLVERITVIKVLALRGKGVPGSPVRQVIQYWSDGGELLAEHDPEPEATPIPPQRWACLYCSTLEGVLDDPERHITHRMDERCRRTGRRFSDIQG